MKNTNIKNCASKVELSNWLTSPLAIRESCLLIYQAGLNRELAHFEIDLDKLEEVVGYVKATIFENYPTLNIPMHSRWRHFQLQGKDRWKQIATQFDLDGEEKTRVSIELVVCSVLVDAGAGNLWRYRDPETGLVVSRSEGLAIASLNAFAGGLFSSDPSNPASADLEGLSNLTIEKFAEAFQVTSDNPLEGVEGRVSLLNSLGLILEENLDIFDRSSKIRIGNLFDYLKADISGDRLEAIKIFNFIITIFGSIWPGRIVLEGINLGDTWPHPAAVSEKNPRGLTPFHKLSQWLTYSLIEPFQAAGIRITEVESLTALAEYRNGGLLIDFGLLIPKDNKALSRSYTQSDELVVEWRALTISLIDIIAGELRRSLKMNPNSLPMTKILEGGTWAAGRAIALSKRRTGCPPINFSSDGSIF